MNARSYDPSRPPRTRLRIARRRLDDAGEVCADLIGEALARSWQRCLAGGLPQQGRSQGGPHASVAQCTRANERAEALLRHALPVMELLLPHVRATGSVLLLADAAGMVLTCMGDDSFATRAQRVALRPGALWSEPVRGTNAIGTALADGRPVAVLGAEHYLARNAFLSCGAAPIADSQGRILGALDVSGDHRALPAAALPATLGLVCMAARTIERSLFEAAHAGDWRLRLHQRRDGLGSAAQASLALGEDGALRGADGVARECLGTLSSVPPSLAQVALSAAADGEPQQIELEGLGRWWATVERPQRGAVPSLPAVPAADAAAQRAVFVRARALLDDAGWLLVRASPDAELQAFATALHRIGPHRDGRLVRADASTLTGPQAWQRVLGDLGDGTLLLTGVEALPLPTQAAVLVTLSAARDFDLVATHATGLGAGVLAGQFRVDLQERLQTQSLRRDRA